MVPHFARGALFLVPEGDSSVAGWLRFDWLNIDGDFLVELVEIHDREFWKEFLGVSRSTFPHLADTSPPTALRFESLRSDWKFCNARLILCTIDGRRVLPQNTRSIVRLNSRQTGQVDRRRRNTGVRHIAEPIAEHLQPKTIRTERNERLLQ